MNNKAMIDHFLLKCDACGWHSAIDEACLFNPCPNCRRYNSANLVFGTKTELITYIEKLRENNG